MYVSLTGVPKNGEEEGGERGKLCADGPSEYRNWDEYTKFCSQEHHYLVGIIGNKLWQT